MEASNDDTSNRAGEAKSGSTRAGQVDSARRALAENPRLWYHTIDLAPGISTPGFIDLRAVAERVLPDDLSGKRALDIGTFDGFWAFEMEKRGAEVVAIDLDRIDSAEFPPLSRPRLEKRAEAEQFELGTGFRLAAEALQSRVNRIICNVYELDAAAIGGPVHFAFNGATLTHLRDPIRALERVHGVLDGAGSELRSYEPFSVPLTLRSPRRPSAEFRAHISEYTWWLPNLAAIAAWLRAARFEEIRRVSLTRPPSTEPTRYVAHACRPA